MELEKDESEFTSLTTEFSLRSIMTKYFRAHMQNERALSKSPTWLLFLMGDQP